MPVTNITPDKDNLRLNIEAEFAAPIERLWELYSDPRQIEKVFGPPGFPATFVAHKLTPGTRSKYYMTGPEGEKYCGVWDVTSVNQPKSFQFDDAFADEEFNVNTELPVSQNTYAFESTENGTRATFVTQYSSAEALQQVLDMGVAEGASAAINQIDDFLAA